MKKKAAEVHFVNEKVGGNTEVVKGFDDLALMYPFRVFKKGGSLQNMRQFKHFVLYIFLDAGELAKVFPDGMATAKALLAPSIDLVSATYDAKGK